MSKNANHISHIKSKVVLGDGSPKLPSAENIVEGEIAINYAKGIETLSIKNDESGIASFSSDDYYTSKKLGNLFTGANSANTVTSVANSISGALTSHTASTVHMTTIEKTNLDSLATNIGAISGITATKVSNWDDANSKKHTHSNKSYLDTVSGSVGTMAYENKTSYYTVSELDDAHRVIAQSLNELNERKLDAAEMSDYYTKSQIDTALAGKSDTSHNHDGTYAKQAFKNVKVGETIIAADTIADTLTVSAGTFVSLTPDASNDKLTIGVSTGTSSSTLARGDHNHDSAYANKSSFETHTASTSHMSTTEKTNLDSLATNIAAISGVSSTKVSNWDTAYGKVSAVTATSAAINSLTGTVGTMAFENKSNYYTKSDLTGSSTTVVVKKAASATTAASAESVALANVTSADDLKAIEAIAGTSGLLKKTAANTWSLDTTSYSTAAAAVASGVYNTTNKTIDLKNAAGTVVSTIDATAFIKDGMVSNVEVKNVASSGTCIVITFNTDAGKDTINIPITQIFDASNYYTKDELTGSSATAVVKKAASATTAASAASVALAGVTNADDLKAIEALTGTSGLLKKTAANTWALDTTAYSSATQVNAALATKSDTGHTHDGTYAKSAFTKVMINSTVLNADSTGDTLTITAGTFVTLTPDASNDKFTIGVSTGTSSSTLARGDHNHDDRYYQKNETYSSNELDDAHRVIAQSLNELNERKLDASEMSSYSSATEINAALATKAGTGVTINTASGLTGGGNLSQNRTLGLAATGTSGTYGPSADVTGTEGTTIKVPQITTDKYGRVTAVTERTYTSKNSTYTAATAAPGKVATNSASGTSTNYARQDHTHGIDLASGDSNGQVKIAGTNVTVKGINTMAYEQTSSYSSATQVNTALSGKAPTSRKVSAGAGLTGGGDLTSDRTIKAALSSETKSSLSAATMGTTANRQYAVGLDANGVLSVNIPWTNTNSAYVQTSRKVSTASGLTGGGDLTADRTIGLAATGTSGTYGPSADVTGNDGTTIKIPQITTDSYGRVTSVTERTLTNKNSTYTVNNGTFAISGNGASVASTSANASANSGLNIKAGTNVQIATASSEITISATDTKYTAATAAPGKVASASSVGTSTNYARQDHTHGIDLATGDSNGQVKIAGTNVSVKGINTAAYKAEGYFAGSGHTHDGTYAKNAFKDVKVGETTIAADTTADTLTMSAGTFVTLTPDSTNDK